MKKFLFIIFLLINSNIIFGQNLTSKEIHRIGDYGKLWGVIKLFHPELAYNNINADSLFTNHVNALLSNPSAENFKKAIQEMLDDLHDPNTTIRDKSTNKKGSVIISKRTYLKWLADSVALIHFDDDFINENSSQFGNKSAFLKLLDTIHNAKAIIFDLRRTNTPEDYTAYNESDFFKILNSFFINNDIMNPSYRSRIHYGHESQTFDMSSFYYQGWFTANASYITKNKSAIQKPLCFITNRFNNNLTDGIAAMQQQAFAKVIADDSLGNFDGTQTYQMNLADSVLVNVSVAEIVYPNGCKNFTPDALIKHNNQNHDALINKAIEIVKDNSQQQSACKKPLQNTFITPKTITNDSLMYPPPAARLWGLMNYWTELNYFCANKDRFQKNWDSVLYEYVPQFLNAKDSFEYNLAAAKLITEIHDGHGWFGSTLWSKLYLFIPPVILKYVEGKTIVYKVLDDSLKTQLHPGDEIIKVDNKNVDTIRKWFTQYIGASNDASLQRDVNTYVLAGTNGSKFNLTYKHNGAVKSAELYRTLNRYAYDGSLTNKDSAIWKKINNNIGYVDFGRVQVKQLDSMFNDFKNTKTIIIDDRTYPQGTVWTMVNYLTTKPFVTGAKGITMIADNPDPATETKQYSLWQIPNSPKTQYKGSLIILVNEETQSQAEYSCMVLQAAIKNTIIIGSQTAGADGDVTGIKFPGGISTAFSGHGVLYPDGRTTQGIGIVPDIKISPTIKGIKDGKDEVLARAIQFAETGK